jgi:DNA-damage-inducible protein J
MQFIAIKQIIDFCFTLYYIIREGDIMAMVNFRMNETLKKRMELACEDMGMSLTTAFTIFATKVANERRIPFEVSADPFYSASNIAHLENIVSDIKQGRAQFVEHPLIED